MSSDEIDDEIVSFLSLDAPGDRTAEALEKLFGDWTLAYPGGPLGGFLSINLKIKGLNPTVRNFLSIIGASVDCWGGFAYHSAQHHLEVFIISMILSRDCPNLRPLLAIGAVGHDYEYHPDETGVGAPFLQERHAASFVTQMMEVMHRQPEPPAGAVRAVILSTYPGVRNALRGGYGMWRDRLREGNPGVPLDLSRDVYKAACLLADADLIDSTGFSETWAGMKAALLSHEEGRIALASEKVISFYENIVGERYLTDEAEALFGHNLRHNRTVALKSARDELRSREARAAEMQRAADRTEVRT